MARGQEKAKEAAIEIVLPEGRLINGYLFVKNAFKSEKGRESVPAYRAEMAWPKDDTEFNKTIDEIIGHVRAKYGENVYVEGVEEPEDGLEKVVSPFLDGDDLARKREKKGKKGDAYKGMFVIRSKTTFNYEGQDADGGISVYDGDLKRVAMLDKGKVFNGSYGCEKVTINWYETDEGDPAFSFYLKAYQYTRDGEKLASEQDHSSSFKPVGRAAASEGGRRARRG